MVSKKDQSRIAKSNVATSKAHERKVAELLTEWSGIEFRRRRVTGRDDAVRIVELVSDVISTRGDFRYAIECKKGKGFSLDALMTSPRTSLFTNWWHQTCYDAQLVTEDLKRVVSPMIFFKPVPAWTWIGVSAESLCMLKTKAGKCLADCMDFPHLLFDHYAKLGPVDGNVSHSKKNKKIVGVHLDPVIICRWHDFAANVDPMSAFASLPKDIEEADDVQQEMRGQHTDDSGPTGRECQETPSNDPS